MIHLEPLSGLWETCKAKKSCSLAYHAPVEEGEIAYTLLMETYAAEELARQHDVWFGSPHNMSFHWLDKNQLLHRQYGLPAAVPSSGEGAYLWSLNGMLLGRCFVTSGKPPKWEEGANSMLPAAAKLYMETFILPLHK